MKIQITMKNPDCVADAYGDAVSEEIAKLPGLDEEEKESLRDIKMEKVREMCKTWVEYDEYIRIEIDTEANTARVLKVNE